MAEDTGANDGPLMTAIAGYWDTGNVHYMNILQEQSYQDFADIKSLKELFSKQQIVTVGLGYRTPRGWTGHTVVGYRLDQSADDPDQYWLHIYDNNNPRHRIRTSEGEKDAANLLRVEIRKVIDSGTSQYAGTPKYTYEFDYLIYTEYGEERNNPWSSSKTGGNLNFMYGFAPLDNSIPIPYPPAGKRLPASVLPEPEVPLPAPPVEQPVPAEVGIGSYVQMGTYNGKPILWRIIHLDGDEALLFADRIITLKAFDAAGDPPGGRDHDFKHRFRLGSNYWKQSNIREWLKSNEARVTFSTQPPDMSHVAWGYDSYAHKPGFLTNFLSKERDAIIPVTHKVLLSWWDWRLKQSGGVSDDIATAVSKNDILVYHQDIRKAAAGYDRAIFLKVTDQVFLLSVKELHDYVYINGMDIRVYVTAEANAASQVLKGRHNLAFPWHYWLHTPLQGGAATVRYVSNTGEILYTDAYGAVPGVRPAVYVSLDSLTGCGTAESPLQIK